jgi:hypothetical protein
MDHTNCLLLQVAIKTLQLANAIEMVRMSERIRELEINKPTFGRR